MDYFRWKYLVPLILLSSCAETTTHRLENGTLLDDLRQPRVSGRIVKLYSGTKPEPIYCSGEGFQQDPTNCAIFYRCVKSSSEKYIVFRFQCGPGTVYDPETEICNHPRSTKRSECWNSAVAAPTTEKHGENEIPSDWSRPELPSPINTRKPIYPDQSYRETSPTVYPWSTSTKSTDISSTRLPQRPSAPIRKPSLQEGDQCTTDGFMGDSEDCRKFYRCVGNQRGGFIRYEFTCSDATVWDDEAQSCNHPWAVRKRSCSRSIPEDRPWATEQKLAHSQISSVFSSSKPRDSEKQSSNNEHSSISTHQQQKQINYGNNVSQTQTQISHNSVIQNQTQINYGERNKKENSKVKQNQTQISYGSAVSQTQTQINHGNKAIQTQLQIDHSKGASQTQSQESQNSSPKPTTESEHSSGGQTNTQPPGNDDNENECTESGFMGAKNNCKRFYRCVDNGKGGYTKYEFTCGEGTVWDPDIEACNHEWAVKKCGGKAPGENSSQNAIASTSSLSSSTQSYQTTTEEEEEDAGYGNLNQPSQTSTKQPITENIPKEPEETTTQNQQTAGNECNSSGFMADKNDCKKFYRCVDNGKGYTRYEFTCGEGTVWDPDIEACNHPWATKNCGGQSSTDAHTEMITSSKPELSDEYLESSQVTSTEKEQDYNDSGYHQPTADSSTTFTTQKPSATSENQCSQEGFVGDEDNCKKFYRCVDNGKGGFTRYEFTCGEGTVWDQEILGCNHDTGKKACKTSQQSQPPQEQSTDSETSTQPSSNNDQHSTTQKPESSSQTSSGQCDSEGFYPNLDDCKKFYRCVDNGKGGYTKYDFSCGEGTVWVQEIQACDHDNDLSTCSKSDSSSSSSNTASSSTTTQATTQHASSTEPTSSTSNQSQQPSKEDDEYPTQSSSEKPGESEMCTSEGFYPNKDDCRRFYRCVDNGNGGYTRYDFDCGEGTAWDSEIQTCNHISEVKSCEGQDTQSKPVQDEEQSQSTASTNSGASSTTTTSSGSSTESSKPSSEDKCEQEGYYGNSQDCKKFYRCVDNGKGSFTKYDFDCGEGTIWDQDITTCNHPQDVSNPSCKQDESESSSSQSSDGSTTSSTTSQPSDQTSSTTESNKEEGSSNCENSSKKPANKNVNCTQAGYYADPDDCKKFYRCVDWDGNGKKFSVYHFECGEGTIWDPALDTCNHEDSVYPPRDCSGSQSQSETESTTSKQDKTTTEESTTQTSTTEQTPTEESTTQATTENSQEQTTQQSETEKTTTQQTTEKTTTQQTTEKTTTQKTTEQTTTQQTTEQTTTQQTTEQTTTQQTTEQTTTQQSTEKITTQETTEQTMTEQTTTQTSNTEQSTTQQMTEQTTQESSTSQTEPSTTQQTTEGTTQESMTEQQENQTEENSESTTESSSSDKECPETDDDQNVFVCPTSFRRHPKYCNIFYQCTEDEDTHDADIATFHCPNNTIYDETQVKCVEKDKAQKKCDGEIAEKRRFKRLDASHKEPIVISTEDRLKCPTVGHYPFEKFECSSAFLKCLKSKSGKIRGFVYQCPQGSVYWSVSRKCEPINKVRDCKKSYNDWSRRWEIPIERRNVAL